MLEISINGQEVPIDYITRVQDKNGQNMFEGDPLPPFYLYLVDMNWETTGREQPLVFGDNELAVKLVPLLPFAVTVFRGHNRGYIWMSFVVIFYFTQAVVSAWLSEGAPGPVILTVLTFLLFTVAMIHLKVNRPVADGNTP